MRWLLVILLMSIAACSNVTHELPQTSEKDPIWQLNEGKWTYQDNALTTVPVASNERY